MVHTACNFTISESTAMSSYDYVFLAEVPDEYTCPICSNPMKEPVQTKCGHRFCRLCLEKSMERMQECPIDRGDLDADTPTDIFPDKASERKILDFEVKCPNEIDGCQWTGELRNVEAHEASCDFVKVKCGNVNCSAIVLRWDLQHHKSELCPRRTVSCIYCGAVYVWCLEEVFCSLFLIMFLILIWLWNTFAVCPRLVGAVPCTHHAKERGKRMGSGGGEGRDLPLGPSFRSPSPCFCLRHRRC